MSNEIPRHEEIRREPHRCNDFEFVRHPLDNVVWQACSPAPLCPFPGEVFEIGAVIVETLWEREVRQQCLSEGDLDISSLRDPQRVVTRLGNLPELFTHFGGWFQVVLVSFKPESICVANKRTGLHAKQGVVSRMIFTMRVVRIICSEQRSPNSFSDIDELRVCALLVWKTVILQFDEEIVFAENVLKTRRFL